MNRQVDAAMVGVAWPERRQPDSRIWQRRHSR